MITPRKDNNRDMKVAMDVANESSPNSLGDKKRVYTGSNKKVTPLLRESPRIYKEDENTSPFLFIKFIIVTITNRVSF